MKIGILSRNPNLYSTQRLRQAGQQHGHQMHVVDTLSIIVEMGTADSDTLIKSVNQRPSTMSPAVWGLSSRAVRYLAPFDAIIPRIGTTITDYGLAVVRQFESRHVLTTATAAGIACSRDKLVSLQLMADAGIPTPKTAVLTLAESLGVAMHTIGGPPAIIKINHGTQGRGVILVRNMATAAAVFEKLHMSPQQLLLQEFLPEAEGRDTRIIVVGDTCIAAMERRAPRGDFRSNLHLGGTAVSVKLNDTHRELALAAAKAHNLAIAGVDIIQSSRGPLVLEVNSSPGLEGIEKTTGKDVAGHIIRYLEEQLAANAST